MPAHTKHFALQGLAGITLFIPALFAFYLYQSHSFVQQSCLYAPMDVTKLYPPCYIKPDRPYKTFYCNGNPVKDKKALHSFFLASQKMMREHDTICGVKIHFGKNAKYDSFIKALNVFYETRVALYSFENNYVRAINTSAEEEKKSKELFEKIYGVYIMGPE